MRLESHQWHRSTVKLQADMGRLQHKCNRLRLLATCSITITNEQNHNVIDYDYIETNNDYNRDYIGLQTSSERKQSPFAWFDVSIFQAIKIWTNSLYEITNHGVGTEKKKNHINCLLRYLCSPESVNTLNIN